MTEVLRLRLPKDAAEQAMANGAQGIDGPSGGNLLPPELCSSSFAHACAARRALRASAPAAARAPAPAKKPRSGDADAGTDPATTAASQVEANPVGSAASPGAATTRPGPAVVAEGAVLLLNCRVLDPTAGAYLEGLQRIMLRGGVIRSVEPMGTTAVSGETAAAGPAAAGEEPAGLAVVVDCGGAVLMPGLCDAHVHCTAITANLAGLMSYSESYVVARSGHILAGMLARGFTTIRDAGGADFGLAQAVDEGLVLGPRILFTGHALSQTGGHGDFRGRGEDVCACGAALRGIGRVCDGDAEVRRAARDELRRGAHCIKIMASGGVASPTDRLTNTQFSEAELAAIVEEAAAAGAYVCAHAYTPTSIARAVAAGVRSIEHGNWLDEQTAALMADKGAFLVPTLVTYQELARGGAAAGMPQELVAKVGDAVEAGLKSLAVAHAAGVVMCFGSDLLGDLHPAQAAEFELRARVLPAPDILRAATVNCAELFGMQYTLGRVAPGFAADLLLLAPGCDPLADVRVLATPGGAAVAAVLKGGLLAKAPRRGGGSGGGGNSGSGCGAEGMGEWERLNERLFPAAFWPKP